MGSRFHRVLLAGQFAREGKRGVLNQLDELHAAERRSPAELQQMQRRRLRRLLQHARDHTRFYRERFAAIDFDPDELENPVDLRRVPPLTKNDIQNHWRDMIADNIREEDRHSSSSGGTTGNIVAFQRNNDCLPIKEAGILRFESWSGWELDDWKGLVWPAVFDHPPDTGWRGRLLNRLVRREVLLAMAGEERGRTVAFLQEIVARGATMIRAFPGALMPVAGRIRETGIQLPSLRAVISTGEMLQPHQRRLFESTFQCQVFDSYRSREMGPVAQQCEVGQGLHIAVDLVHVEVGGQPASCPTACRTGSDDEAAYGPLLITDLHNYGMPLIRYDVGDFGAISETSCPCGRNLPLLQGVGGRVMDILYTCDRRPIVSMNVLPNMFLPFDVVNQFQLVQKDWDRVLVRLTLPELPAKIVAGQREVARQIFGKDVEVEYEYVDVIKPSRSGKYRLMVCEIPEEDRPVSR